MLQFTIYNATIQFFFISRKFKTHIFLCVYIFLVVLYFSCSIPVLFKMCV